MRCPRRSASCITFRPLAAHIARTWSARSTTTRPPGVIRRARSILSMGNLPFEHDGHDTQAAFDDRSMRAPANTLHDAFSNSSGGPAFDEAFDDFIRCPPEPLGRGLGSHPGRLGSQRCECGKHLYMGSSLLRPARMALARRSHAPKMAEIPNTRLALGSQVAAGGSHEASIHDVDGTQSPS